MSVADSVTRWIEDVRQGNRAAVPKLLERYFQRLTQLARGRLRGVSRAAADEEDVALSAFHCLIRGLEGGQFTQLFSRNELWRLLVVLTVRKAISQVRKEGRRSPATASEVEREVEQFFDQEPSPEAAAQTVEECRRLLDCLGDEELRAIALWRLEGYTNEEIAEKLGCVPRTVERRLRVIRSLWEQEATP